MDNFIKKYRENGFPFSYNATIDDNMYKNPIIHTDFSDPDVIKVGDDYFMTASSFNNVPALPILHSKDLVNWKTINYAVKDALPFEKYDLPRYGEGVWAPSIRYNDGYFYIYFGMPDEGIFVARTKDIYKDFEPLVCIKEGKGYIDVCPFWDDDGKAYIVHGFAKSRIGFKSVLAIQEMSYDGLSLLDNFRIIFDGNEKFQTIEGPKLYKRDNLYYILAPALGVTYGVQLALKSENIFGPYEPKIVLEQGSTDINGPHQGGLVSKDEKDYFIHFQDKGAYGRIPHLQPVEFIDGYPMMGEYNKDLNVNQPVITHEMPIRGQEVCSDIYSDDFRESTYNNTFQWNANIDKDNFYMHDDYLRLFANKKYDSTHSIMKASNLLTQKFPDSNFTVTTKFVLNLKNIGDTSGFGILSDDYSTISVTKTHNGYVLSHNFGLFIEKQNEASEYSLSSTEFTQNEIYLRIKVTEIDKKAVCSFFYSLDSENFIELKNTHIATTATWVGAKTFVYALSDFKNDKESYVDIDYIVFS